MYAYMNEKAHTSHKPFVFVFARVVEGRSGMLGGGGHCTDVCVISEVGDQTLFSGQD